MFRSLAPSVVRKRKGIDDENCAPPPDGKRRSALRGPLRRVPGVNDSEDSDDDEPVGKKACSATTTSTTTTTTDCDTSGSSLEVLSRLFLSGGEEARVEYEAKIQAILHRPYKCPLKGYALSGLALGGGRDRTRRPKYDPDAEGAMILFSPPTMTAE